MEQEQIRQAVARLVGVNPAMQTVTDFIEAMSALARAEAESIRKREAGEELREIQEETAE